MAEAEAAAGGPRWRRAASSLAVFASPQLLLARIRDNLLCKDTWQEASGALGDLGTYIPIIVALTLVNGLDLGTSLIATGLYNVITGVLFGVPMPVQPMKSIAAVALTEGDPLSVPQIMAAGLSVSAITFVLGITGLIRVVAWLVPLPVVRGIQLAQGLSFAIKAVKYVLKKQNFAADKSAGDRPWLGLDGILLALAAFCFIVLVNGSGGGDDGEGSRVRDSKQPEDTESQVQSNSTTAATRSSVLRRYCSRIPTALVVFLIGIVLAFIRRPGIFKKLRVGPTRPQLVRISAADWKEGFVRGAVPQLPLTVLNSVVAVCKLSKDLFPAKDVVSPSSVSVSVGSMNLVGCWFGALPVCHGAGGLAGQYRFGSTTGLSVVMLGAAKLLLGLLLGSSLIRILAAFPIGLLGILLLFSGVELAMACRDQTSRMDSFVMLTCLARLEPLAGVRLCNTALLAAQAERHGLSWGVVGLAQGAFW